MSRVTQIAGYSVLRHIGNGAASELYAVHDPKTKQIWALKQVVKQTDKDQRFLDQCEIEYQVGSKLDHPNVRGVNRLIKHRRLLKVYEVSLLLELVDAVSLDQYDPKSMLEAVVIFMQIASGLQHMHERGFVHADMKPSNVLVADGPRVKIIDLGQACAIGTVKKRIQGTPGYMAPEQAHRQAIAAQTDIYNFGATMYWVLCREVIPTALPPKEDANGVFSGAIDTEQLKAPIPPHEKDPAIHPLLSKCILECVEVRPEDRPASMSDVYDKLEIIAHLFESHELDDDLDSELDADET
ncbi:MAG: serine/threonine protein kinase, partial [Phycisphaerales bacterium]|nr:serine/threonine protein kinase [Phycisphaerales bacterium]